MMMAIDKDGGSGMDSVELNVKLDRKNDSKPDRQKTKPLSTLRSAATSDLEQLWQWNHTVPPLLAYCMHDIISNIARRQPHYVAVQSWDGSLTYEELDQLSSQLAWHLRQTGIEQGSIIPLCFEKSMWTIVAVLGSMKSGATFTLMDPSQPEARLRTIVHQTGAEIIITSVPRRELGKNISNEGGQVLVISRDYFNCNKEVLLQDPLPTVQASATMYIIFTSGSTGQPKGVVISHENYTSGALPRAEAVGYKPTSRCFDFPSYAFDVSIDCMLCTLANGGRICVPSDEARLNNLSGAIRQSKANMVHMTPSVARVLDPDIIPSLEVLGLGGEAISAADAAAWCEVTNLIIAYGPSECTVGCTINKVSMSTGIGKGVGSVTWIVDPEDHNTLLPVGAIGELLVEGPVVGNGYLNEDEKTAEVFIRDPTWLVKGFGSTSGRCGRLYKTGDLVRYESNNSGFIEFVGRKDQQVKLRGQRVELPEVEHHVRACLPTGIKVAVELIKPSAIGSHSLVAFVCEPISQNVNESHLSITKPTTALGAAIQTITKKLDSRVPSYMIPSAFIPLMHMPTLVSGKIDRKKLREIGSSIPLHIVNRIQRTEFEQQEEPADETESMLRLAWLEVLGQDVKVFRQSNFFGLGGDSLSAMKLIAEARNRGIVLTVADIFKSPDLASLAAKSARRLEIYQENVEEFSLLEKSWDIQAAKTETATLCNVEENDIEDIYPCTPLQEALMALSAKVQEAYVAQRVVQLEDVTAAEHLLSAFDVVQSYCSILRTRIVQAPRRGLVQVVVRGRLCWHTDSSLVEYLARDRANSMDLGMPLIRYAIIDDASTHKINFVLTMHHALYDGWTMPLIIDQVNKAYRYQAISPLVEFKYFIKYLSELDREKSAGYWRTQLQGANGSQFPCLPWQDYQARADSLLELYIPLGDIKHSRMTAANIIRGAWALVASQYINNSDVIFGETLTGRNAPLVASDQIEGPMITTIPVRIHVNGEESVSEYLQKIQKQTVDQIPHEHFGLQHIRKLGTDAFVACELRTGLVLQPKIDADIASGSDDLPANHLVPAGDAEAAQEALKFNTYALMIVCSIDANGFLAMASFDSNTVARPIMEKVLNQFNRIVQALSGEKSGSIDSACIISETDTAKLLEMAPKANIDEILREYSAAEAAYIVDFRDFNRLLPIGAPGQLVIESIRSLEDASEIPQPSWIRRNPDSVCHNRFYMTGRTAQYNWALDNLHIELVKPDIQANAMALSTSPKIIRVSPSSRRQRKLQKLWGHVLRLNEDDIGLNDSFFLLGGDSIAAMRLVSEARQASMKLTVAQVFQKRTLYEMANIMEEMKLSKSISVNDPAAKETEHPFLLIGLTKDKTGDFINHIIRPRLESQSWKIADVLPTRPLQQIAVKGTTDLPRFSLRYELIYFDSVIDRHRLVQSCHKLVARNEILRTVFVEHSNEVYAVVLDELVTPFVEYSVDTGIEGFAKQMCRLDALTKIRLGSGFVKWFLVESVTGPSCLVFRLSHAQYDEICLPLMLRQLSNLYNGEKVADAVPFSSYVSHIIRKNVIDSVPYWKTLLAGSSITTLEPQIPIKSRKHFTVQATIDISARSRDITVASLPTAAWALCLARRLNLRDVTFGEVVSGRNIDLPNDACGSVIGPCWQYVPVRVKFPLHCTGLDVLLSVQHQHIASSAYEGISLSEIALQCGTDWLTPHGPNASDLWFDSVVHQDVEHIEVLDFADAGNSRLKTLYAYEEPLREWKIQSFVQNDGERMTLEIITFESWGKYAEGLLSDLVDAAITLERNPQAKLFDESM